jgi:hypothetical protein
MGIIGRWIGTMGPLARVSIVLWFVAGSGVTRAKPDECNEFPVLRPSAQLVQTLTPIRSYRNYLAVSDVQPAGRSSDTAENRGAGAQGRSRAA